MMPIVVRRPLGSEAFGALSLLTRMPAAALSFLARSPLTDWGRILVVRENGSIEFI